MGRIGTVVNFFLQKKIFPNRTLLWKKLFPDRKADL